MQVRHVLTPLGRILPWIARAQRPIVSTVEDKDALRSFKTADETVFVAYLDPEDEGSRKTLGESAERFREEFTFGVVLDKSLAETENLSPPAVICYKPVDGDTVKFTDIAAGREKFDEWVLETSRPVIGELLPWNHERYLKVRTRRRFQGDMRLTST